MITICVSTLAFIFGVLFGYAYRMAGSSTDERGFPVTFSGVARVRRAIGLMSLLIA